MLDQLIDWDRRLLIFLNSLHADWLDPVMFYASKTAFWAPLYLFLGYLLYRVYGRKCWVPLCGIAITLILSDQITSSLMKPFFERLRPSQEPSLNGVLHLVNGYKGGLYGFASSHAANTFATASFFWWLLKNRYRWIGLLFVWAVVMTYTRIYLGVHYPGDILVGMMVGILAAVGGHGALRQLSKRTSLPK